MRDSSANNAESGGKGGGLELRLGLGVVVVAKFNSNQTTRIVNSTQLDAYYLKPISLCLSGCLSVSHSRPLWVLCSRQRLSLFALRAASIYFYGIMFGRGTCGKNEVSSPLASLSDRINWNWSIAQRHITYTHSTRTSASTSCLCSPCMVVRPFSISAVYLWFGKQKPMNLCNTITDMCQLNFAQIF